MDRTFDPVPSVPAGVAGTRRRSPGHVLAAVALVLLLGAALVALFAPALFVIALIGHGGGTVG